MKSQEQGTVVDAQEVRSQLERILQSRAFRNSERLQRFLRFAVEGVLEKSTDRLKESVLGRVVFDRGSSYDPRTDSIVRVESQRLRRRLREYYEGEGREDPVVIAFHAGSYVPTLEYMTPARVEPEIESRTRDGSSLSPQTVAVLPFQNQSPDPDQEFFCEGITDDIIFALSRVPGLNVIGHTSVFALNPASQDVNEMASRLGAGTLVDGSVRKSGKTLKIFAEMIDAATGEVRWAEMYDRTLGDLFTVESEIAESVARVLQMTLAPPISKRLIRGAPNMEAYLLYLKGRYEFNRLSSDGYRKAVEVFTQATTEFPSYASSYAGLADAYAYQAVWGCARPRDVFPLAQEAAAKAIKLDPLLAHAYSAQAAALAFYEWKCDEAVKSARRGSELEPSFGFGHHIYGCCQLCRGEREAARDCFERAVVLDPLSVRAHRVLGWDLYLERRPHTAEKWLQAALSLDREPMETRLMLAHVYLSDGRLTPALEQARLCQSDPPDPLALGLLGACLGRLGRRDEAAEIVERLSRMSEKMYVDPHAITEVHLALENTDLALESIQKSLDERTPSSVFMQLDPEFDQIRSDARFKDLLSRVHA